MIGLEDVKTAMKGLVQLAKHNKEAVEKKRRLSIDSSWAIRALARPQWPRYMASCSASWGFYPAVKSLWLEHLS